MDSSQAPSSSASTPPRQRQNRGPPGQGDNSSDRRRGGRGRGQGRGRGNSRGDINSNNTGPGRTFGSGLSGSQQQSQRPANGPAQYPAAIRPAPTVDPGGISSERPAGDANPDQGVISTDKAVQKTGGGENEDEEVDAEVCFICASPVEHNAVAPCNHRTCHICSLRLRALYRTKACAHCRTQSDLVIFTDDPVKRFEDYSPGDIFRTDSGLGIEYEKPEIFEDTLLLLRYNCPDGDCDVACLGWPDLHRHVKTVHQKHMCDLCTRNKKVFTHEHELFTKEELRQHERYGDDNPGAIDQTGFKGHPECGFCRRRFYGDDELYTHCREKHERCHVCDRRSGGVKPQYYLNYEALELHFRKDHFVCPDRECLEKKFVVFGSEMDLKAHQIEAHPNGLTKDALRDARRVDMSDFSLREQYQPNNRRRDGDRQEGGRGRGRGRDPNAEAIPPSTQQPMRRDEIAFQRQMAIQSASSSSVRTFGGQLSTPSQPTYAARAPADAPAPAAVAAPRPAAPRNDFPSLGPVAAALDGTTPRSSSPAVSTQPLTPQEQARRMRHNAVVERASNLLKGNPTKLAEFRANISAYRGSTVSANDLIDGFFVLFDSPAAELGKLIKELADIFEIASKRDNLLKAWNDWRAINEDYPTLPGGSSTSSVPASTLGGKRVLKLKSSTAQSSRSAVSRAAGWGTSGSQGIFPSLAAAAAGPASRSKAVKATPWASTAGSTPSVAPATVRPAPAVSRANGAPPSNNAASFPSLPAAAKPSSSVFSPGYRGAGVRRDLGLSTLGGNAWTPAGSGASTPLPQAESSDAGPATGGQGKKGKQGKKQVLISWG